MTDINVCLTCESSRNLSKPMSFTTGNHVHSVFSCNTPPTEFSDAYGWPLSTPYHNMIVDLVTMCSWIDGSSHIPSEGCSNYKRSNDIHKEVQIQK